ncbi:hypothetical protein BpHYR1_039861 [Brachionus plicatilis]|uniref:Uncharacterized protein n=1 Tax=Brachionus plicatilis TaxID=10195 RepID=A0A3M7RK26_BRAPC|nr:hypothetical protein BpHYR1_039861 [Brachionus plicatilis]
MPSFNNQSSPENPLFKNQEQEFPDSYQNYPDQKVAGLELKSKSMASALNKFSRSSQNNKFESHTSQIRSFSSQVG